MEALTLLRYSRSNGGHGTTNANAKTSTGNTTTIVTGVNNQASETGDEDEDENDHGPFFDLEFSLPAEDDKNGETEDDDENEEDSGGSDESENGCEMNVSISPSDDLFFNGGFVPVDQTTDPSSKSPQFRLGLMKSATKFRVMMLKLRKSKMNPEEAPASQNGEGTDSGKEMTVRFNVEEVPIVSLFKRHNSSKRSTKRQNDNNINTRSASGVSEEKKFSKETMQKYLQKVKPLYVRVSQKYGNKLKLAGNPITKPSLSPSCTMEEQKQNPRREKESMSEVAEPPLLPVTAKGLKQGNLPAGLRVVCKHLGKSWSGSSAIAATSAAAPGAIPSKRRDDSLIQQEDGIQSAIFHCKRSFKASRGVDAAPAAGECENRSSSDAADGEGAENMNK